MQLDSGKNSERQPDVAVIGAGPTGLMAAEVIAAAGLAVDVFDAMPSPARKFLRAGVGGMNITHAEAFDAFVQRYGERAENLRPLLQRFGADQLRQWIHELGIETFVGSSGRVFPTEMKAAPLLRAWLQRLRSQGVRIHTRQRWLGFTPDHSLLFSHQDNEHIVHVAATVLATGGASWPQLGSDGGSIHVLEQHGVEINPLRPANCGFDIHWSAHVREKFAGTPLKPVSLRCIDIEGKPLELRGEVIITAAGIEGSAVYALSAPLRERIAATGAARLEIDLLPEHPLQTVVNELQKPRGSQSLSSHLRKRLGLQGIKAALLYEMADKSMLENPQRLAQCIKALPLTLIAPRPLEEAISTAGGVRFEALDANLMLRQLPGVFCAGEMLDWEAPTGGYLLSACFATARACGDGVVRWLGASAR
jgi:uncharacterized flavoprotein (TIGR03862 family)